MKAKDIITEDFWSMQAELDKKFNPEAFDMKTAEEEKVEKPAVITRYKDDSKKFTNKPQDRRHPSLGWIGKVRAKYKAGHITKEQMEKLLNIR